MIASSPSRKIVRADRIARGGSNSKPNKERHLADQNLWGEAEIEDCLDLVALAVDANPESIAAVLMMLGQAPQEIKIEVWQRMPLEHQSALKTMRQVIGGEVAV